MGNKRESYSDNEHSILYAETNGICPLCANPILAKKKGSKKPIKRYELAHIYPLNPTPFQVKVLIDYPVPVEINGLENIIALCSSCHDNYDKDFKLEELIKLKEMKTRFLNDTKARESISKYPIEEEIYEILDVIIDHDDINMNTREIDLNLSTVDQKLKTGMNKLQVRQIKINAADYYIRIRNRIKLLEQQDQLSVKLLQSQIKTFSLAMQKQYPDNKELVFNYISNWISKKTNKALIAVEILVAFFIQNCEVFDVDT